MAVRYDYVLTPVNPRQLMQLISTNVSATVADIETIPPNVVHVFFPASLDSPTKALLDAAIAGYVFVAEDGSDARGPPGPQGIPGIQGIQGIQGPAGNQGIQGLQGDAGISPTMGTNVLSQISTSTFTSLGLLTASTFNVNAAQAGTYRLDFMWTQTATNTLSKLLFDGAVVFQPGLTAQSVISGFVILPNVTAGAHVVTVTFQANVGILVAVNLGTPSLVFYRFS